MKKFYFLAIALFASVAIFSTPTFADENISISFPENGQTYSWIGDVIADINNPSGVNARVRWGIESGVYTNSEIHAIEIGEGIDIPLNTPFSEAGTYFLKVELQDSESQKIGDSGEINFLIEPGESETTWFDFKDFTADLTTSVGDNITGVSPVIVSVFALIAAFWIVPKIISLFKNRK